MTAQGVDVLVVGAGFSGAVMAERLANEGARVMVVDRRPHIGGNAFDELDAHGILVHRYGPHIFHTNSDAVWAYLSRFTEWRPYEHRVLASVRGDLLPVPINRTTLERVYGVSLPDDEAAARLLESLREDRGAPRTSEDVVVGTVGRELFSLFFEGYTRKQWGRPASALNASVTARIPVRTNRDDRYFTDTHQAIPRHGYTRLFERILDHPNITVRVGETVDPARPPVPFGHMVWTGPVDAYFSHRFGRLPYRSLRFEYEHLPHVDRYQPVAQVNYPGDEPFTRITEYKQLTGQQHAGTTIVREFSSETGDPYYPVPSPESRTLAERYHRLAEETRGVTFVGRLAQYRYYNMDQATAAALAAARRLVAGEESVEQAA